MTLALRNIGTRIVAVIILAAATAAALHYSKTIPLSRAQPGQGARAPRSSVPPRQVVAPEGVFFLTDRVVLKKSAGITAIVPGTAIRVLSQKGDTFHVTDGKVNFDVGKEQLTNDVNRAALLSGNDLATEEAIAEQMAGRSDEFKTTSGKIYSNATVNRVEPDGIVLVTNSGVSKIYFTELPPDVQERFHYDPEAAAAYSSSQAASQAAFQKEQEELRRKKAEENNKYWTARATAPRQSAPAASAVGAGQPVKVIAHGERVDINRHLAFGRVTIIDFYADWCGPCREVSPHLEQMANSDPEVAVRKIDIVNWKTPVALQYSLRGIPTIHVYGRRGNLVGTVVGGDVEQVRRYVAQAKASS